MKIGKNIVHKPFLFVAIFLLLIILFLFFNTHNYISEKISIFNSIKNTESQTVNTEKPKIVSCTRTTRLDNEPQYDRALSLIYQRISEAKGTKYKYFPPELTNCIKIIEEKIDESSETEGYFIFNSKDIKINYYPIIVNSRYQEADDVVIALLLMHEMNHVQQYINTQNGKTPLSCIESEIESFLAQRDFWAYLNTEEASSLISRYNSDESLHPQIKILFLMLGTHSESGCGDFFNFKCYEDHIHDELKQIITTDSYYKKQCEL